MGYSHLGKKKKNSPGVCMCVCVCVLACVSSPPSSSAVTVIMSCWQSWNSFHSVIQEFTESGDRTGLLGGEKEVQLAKMLNFDRIDSVQTFLVPKSFIIRNQHKQSDSHSISTLFIVSLFILSLHAQRFTTNIITSFATPINVNKVFTHNDTSKKQPP